MEKNAQDVLAEKVKVGDVITYVNPEGNEISALVTAVWSPRCVNIVFVSLDNTRQDSYGVQIERTTSLIHKQFQPAPGNYWYGDFPTEKVE